jgi:hypothetical protein
MKKFELYIAIAMFIITTFLIIIIPISFEYSIGMLAILSFVSFVGYVAAYLFLDSFLSRHEMHHYFKGYDAGRGLFESSPKTKPFYNKIQRH